MLNECISGEWDTVYAMLYTDENDNRLYAALAEENIDVSFGIISYKVNTIAFLLFRTARHHSTMLVLAQKQNVSS